MLFEKIVRLGASFEMVKDIVRISNLNAIFIVSQCNAHPAMLCWQRGVSYEKSSELIPSPCEHVSSDEGLFFEDNQLAIAAAAFELQPI